MSDSDWDTSGQWSYENGEWKNSAPKPRQAYDPSVGAWVDDPNGAIAQATSDKQFKDTYNLSGQNTTPLTWDPNSKAPTYDVSTQAGWDHLQQLAKVADYGEVKTGLQQFGQGIYGMGGEIDADTLKMLAGRMGFDLSNYRLDDAGQRENTKKALEAEANNYVTLKALTGGWGGTGDPREAATTLYKNDGGTLRAVNDPFIGRAAEKGSWMDEHGAARVGILGAALVASAGLAGVGAAGAGAAASGGGAAAGTAAGTTAGTAAGTGAAAASTGAGLSGMSGAIASALGPQAAAAWGGLSAVQQAAVLGALQGGVQGGLSGGGWKGALKGAALGGISGGVGAYAGPALSGATGLPGWASKAAVSSALGGAGAAATGGDWKRAALSAGLGSLATSGLGGAGVNSQIAKYLGGMAGGYGSSALLGSGQGVGGGQAVQGLGGARSGVGGLSAGVGGASGAGTGVHSGQSTQDAFMNEAYGAMAAEAQRKKLAEEIRQLQQA